MTGGYNYKETFLITEEWQQLWSYRELQDKSDQIKDTLGDDLVFVPQVELFLGFRGENLYTSWLTPIIKVDRKRLQSEGGTWTGLCRGWNLVRTVQRVVQEGHALHFDVNYEQEDQVWTRPDKALFRLTITGHFSVKVRNLWVHQRQETAQSAKHPYNYKRKK